MDTALSHVDPLSSGPRPRARYHAIVSLTSPIPSFLPFLSPKPGTTSTLCGGTEGIADGVGTAARFRRPRGVCVDRNGNIFVADTGNHRIRMVTPSGVVSTYAGRGLPGKAAGFRDDATFYEPAGIGCDQEGSLFVADTGNHLIRHITAWGDVITLAGSYKGYADGSGCTAWFNSPYGETE